MPATRVTYQSGSTPRQGGKLLASLSAPVSVLWKHRTLALQLIRRETEARYRGSALGLLWALLTPLAILGTYSFVFSVIFPTKWESLTEVPAAFVLFLFAGMLTFGLFSDTVNRAPGLVLENVSYVKKIVFPLEILPWVSLGSTLVLSAIGFLLLVAARWLILGTLAWTTLLLPLVLLPLIFLVLAIGWLLASLGVFLRDLRQGIGPLTLILMFLSPVFYPASAVPAGYQALTDFNPMFFMIESVRAVVILDQLPDLAHWAAMLMLGYAAACAGFWWFIKTKRGFADVV